MKVSPPCPCSHFRGNRTRNPDEQGAYITLLSREDLLDLESQLLFRMCYNRIKSSIIAWSSSSHNCRQYPTKESISKQGILFLHRSRNSCRSTAPIKETDQGIHFQTATQIKANRSRIHFQTRNPFPAQIKESISKQENRSQIKANRSKSISKQGILFLHRSRNSFPNRKTDQGIHFQPKFISKHCPHCGQFLSINCTDQEN
jgi:hypothetical protein